ncbi:MAG: UvrD-helicase domain-containing protein [Acidimicrobiia bacterium]|nr:UvrD-helicase domain-containing protein [Acidimicrobiia bacterium]
MTAHPTFDLTDTLPKGRLAIEASAGTGKTFTLATLAARYVAEAGLPISDLLVVTFTRAAAAELKDRIRARLVEVADVIEQGTTPSDPALAALVGTHPDLRLQRVTTAIGDFDSATITTIHGFAQQVIGSLGSAVGVDPDAVLVDDTKDLLGQVATDLLAREAVLARHESDLLPKLKDLLDIGQQVANNPTALLVPEPDDDVAGPEATLRRRLVDEVRSGMTDRRRRNGSMSFDDLLVGLRDALCDPTTGPSARRVLQRRFAVALIDEFQDTDPVQWAIFDALFGCADAPDEHAHPSTLVLVGDPKQAIYGFRGASVHTYLEAARAPGTIQTSLDTNWRSDGPTLAALEGLLEGTTFGDDAIAFQPVQASGGKATQRIATADGTPLPTLSVRSADHPDLPRSKKTGYLNKTDAESAIHADLADHVRRLLETAHIPDGDTYRPLEPRDVAVLISAGHEGPPIRAAFEHAGIPAVISRGDNVLDSPAAQQWHLLLTALARPTDPTRARAYAVSWFEGWDATDLDEAPDAEVTILQERLHDWASVLADDGIGAFVGTVRADSGVAARVLGRPDGDRCLTDLDHVAELLQLSSPHNPSPARLLDTFERLGAGDTTGEPDSDLAARRVESEASSVQIMTTFVAKGLEFPVVCCPSLWLPKPVTSPGPVWWDAERRTRVIDVAEKLAWPDKEAQAVRRTQATHDAIGSNLRVLYVALTRARHHTALWWAPVQNADRTGLARVLFARHGGRIDPEHFTAEVVDTPEHGSTAEALTPLVDHIGDTLEVVTVDAPPQHPRRWTGRPSAATPQLDVARLAQLPDRSRGRWSFTAITNRGRHHDRHQLGIDPHDDTLGDSGDADEQVGEADATPTPLPPEGDPDRLPLGEVTGGAGFGTLVHEVLERVDFTDPALLDALRACIDEQLARHPWKVEPQTLADGLFEAIHTSLGDLFGGRALASFAPADRLDELEFDLTLADSGTVPTDAAIGELLLDQLPADDPMRPWATRLARGPFTARLAGHLTGSIDLVARVRQPDGSARYVVADYKTNRLAPSDRSPTMADFHPDRLVDAMAEHHYPLQALLYTVAVHRYLRWRLPDYDPDTHLGGVGYLFVRGMAGPTTPTVDGVPHGLFSWHPPTGLVEALSDLLDGRAGTRTAAVEEVVP